MQARAGWVVATVAGFIGLALSCSLVQAPGEVVQPPDAVGTGAGATTGTGGVSAVGGAVGAGGVGVGGVNVGGTDRGGGGVGPIGPGLAVSVFAGGSRTCVLLAAGEVRCWGAGVFGQLGYGHSDSIGDDEDPEVTPVVDIGGPVSQLALGGMHTCALLTTGFVRCWGAANAGALGYPGVVFPGGESIGDNESPKMAGNVDMGAGVPVERLAAGQSHTCALMQAGAVRCWGWGIFGQLGYANTETIGDNEHPATAGFVDVMGATAGSVVQLAVGSVHTCALLTTGAVRCWGQGTYGQLGYANNNFIGDTETPASAGDVAVTNNGGSPVTQLTAGLQHTCALFKSGAVRCWGRGSFGRLGYGNGNTIGDDEPPSAAGDVPVGGLVAQLVAGDAHNCARMTSGSVRCWGLNTNGQLGYAHKDHIGDNELPTSMNAGDVDVGGPVAQLAAGTDHTCARLMSGAVRCWGKGSLGRLGYGNIDTIGDDETPATAPTVRF